ncbi:superoxide dismutase [Candidatus Uhrbacteria bacterium]|jgi:superoxide dismutase, Fe-Mn family|nr:superoxide dismutase [Candidatus Uhrbacteria bacterium]
MFELPELPFSPDSLAPWTTEETFSYHYGKHHAGYVKKLNAAVEGTDLEGKSLIEVINSSRNNNAKAFNSAAQHFNHSFFWNCLSAEASEPSDELKAQIESDFGSLDSFKEQFGARATTLFGSGWAWLAKSADGKLSIQQHKDAGTPAGTDSTPLLTLDVWEHAYYIDHRNNRGGFIEGFWNHVNWQFVSEQFVA